MSGGTGIVVRTITLKDINGHPFTVPVSDIIGAVSVEPPPGAPSDLPCVAFVARVGRIGGATVAEALASLVEQLEAPVVPRVVPVQGAPSDFIAGLAKFANPPENG